MIQKQHWPKLTRYIITEKDCASVQLELYKKPQGSDHITAYIFALWVDAPQRRKHIATTLMAAAEQIVLNEGHKSVWLEWSKEEAPVEIFNWYQRRGYKEVAFGNRSSLMRKDLK